MTDMLFGSVTKRQKVTENDNESQMKYNLNRRMALWFSCDLLPYSTVEKKGFLDFFVDAKYVKNQKDIPSRTTISVGALDDVYSSFKNRLIDVLSKASTFGTMTFDFWTDNHKRLSYVTYTYHYMDNWQIKTVVLKTAAFVESKHSENIQRHYEQTLQEFKLTEKKITIVTDGGANMIKACRLLNVMRMNCINHSIHLLIMKDMLDHPDMLPLNCLLGKLRKIHFSLIYKYAELKIYDNEEKQKKAFDAVKAAVAIGMTYELLV